MRRCRDRKLKMSAPFNVSPWMLSWKHNLSAQLRCPEAPAWNEHSERIGPPRPTIESHDPPSSVPSDAILHARSAKGRRITDRRRKRALAANPVSKELAASKLRRLAAIRVHPLLLGSEFIFPLVLTPLFDPHFSPHSYGFRLGKRAHQAVRTVETAAQQGYAHAVDCDLKSFFDTVNHNRLLSLLARRVKDGRVLNLIGRYLRAGVQLPEGNRQATVQGVPQGGPLSPLLANNKGCIAAERSGASKYAIG
jgi:hypothetical protein